MASSKVHLDCKDAEIHSWFEKTYRSSNYKKKISKKTITISRQFGCEAYDLAKEIRKSISEKTGEEWVVYDRKLIENVSAATNIPIKFLQQLGDSTHAIDKVASFMPNLITHNEAYLYLKEDILNIARKGNAIIVGRGSSILTKELDNCYRFRLEAPFDYRVSMIEKNMDMANKKAKKYIKTNEASRAKFLEECLNCNIRDPEHYDMVLNSEKSNIFQMSDTIVHLVLLKMKSELEILHSSDKSAA